MRVVLPSGEGIEVSRRRRMRSKDVLIDRDLLMLEMACTGRTHREIARFFNVARQLVTYRLGHKIPEVVRERMQVLVDRRIRDGEIGRISDQQAEPLRRTMRRARGVRRNVERVG